MTDIVCCMHRTLLSYSSRTNCWLPSSGTIDVISLGWTTSVKLNMQHLFEKPMCSSCMQSVVFECGDAKSLMILISFVD